VRSESAKKSEEMSELAFKLSKLEVLPIRIMEVEKVYQDKLSECNRYKAVELLNQSLSDKVAKTEEALAKSSSAREELMNTLMEIKTKNR
jgi:hypothetical protein